MKSRKQKKAGIIFSMILFAFIWQGIALLLNKPLFPPLSTIVFNTFHIFLDRIMIHAIYSLKRILAGIIFTLVAGMPLGILMGYSEKINTLFSPILYLSYPVPKMALLPIIMLLFGLGEMAKIVMIFIITFFPVVVNIRNDVKNIPQETFYPAYSLGANHIQIIIQIILPGIVPSILTALRLGIGTAISILFFTENYGTEYGLGYFVMDAWMRIHYVEMYSGILVLSIVGLMLFMLIDILENILCPWRNIK